MRAATARLWIFLGLAVCSRLLLLFRGAGASNDEARVGANGLHELSVYSD